MDEEGRCQGEAEVAMALVGKEQYHTACLKVTVYAARGLEVRDLFDGVLGYPYVTVRHHKQKRRGAPEMSDDVQQLERQAEEPKWGFEAAFSFRPHQDVVVDVLAEERRGFQADRDPFLGYHVPGPEYNPDTHDDAQVERSSPPEASCVP